MDTLDTKVLFVDGEVSVLESIKRMLLDESKSAHFASNYDEALKVAQIALDVAEKANTNNLFFAFWEFFVPMPISFVMQIILKHYYNSPCATHPAFVNQNTESCNYPEHPMHYEPALLGPA